jgi:hypothetical protein
VSIITADHIWTLVPVVTGAVAGVVAKSWLGKRSDEKTASKKARELVEADAKLKETTTNETLDNLIKQVGEMYVAIVGEDPSPLFPDGRAGILSMVRAVDGRVTSIEHTLFQNGGTGNTVLDRLGRIESLQKGEEPEPNGQR